ncbi:MAG: HAD family hydrolase [Planctomycetota bacterium]|mgnify:CR=1 FL=1|nr:MAG: HAD family hydrolase [Planctomycetota bacterium]
MSTGALPSAGDPKRDAGSHAFGVPQSSPAPRRPAGGPAGLVFDVPDVLYDATLWRRWLLQLVSRLGIRIGYADFCTAWDDELVEVHRGRREYCEALQSFLLGFGLSWPQVDEIEAASRIQRQELELNVRPLPGVVRAIDELAGLDVLLVAWADTPDPAAGLADRLGRIVPRATFKTVLTSCDLEYAQPASECYQAMIAAAGGDGAHTVYVGHDPVHLAAAREAGLCTVAFNFAPSTVADHYLTRFEDLPPLIRNWSERSSVGSSPRGEARR